MDRSEEDKIAQAGIEVILGGKKYDIAPLVIKDSRVWRKKVIELIAPLPALVKTTVDVEHPEHFEGVLTNLMVTMPDRVLDLFFEYAKDLNRDEMESTATDAEIAAAFEQVVNLAFPLVQSLPKAMGQLSQSAEPSSS